MEPLSANDPRIIGGFRLHARLGAGGMGQVYLGFSPAGRAVAIKVIHPQFTSDQEFLRRFSNEVAAASAVGGLYTAPVVDYDLNSASPWLATAYVPGPTLATFIGKHGPLPEAALWRLAAGLAEALRAVHAKGLIHRDLKPANVLLADNGPHVIDFGISRAASSMTQLTSAGMAIGTPGYMSPEQAQGQPVGPPSDLFSLGCVLAYAAAGTPPFHGGNPASILYRIVATEPDLTVIPPGPRQVVQACLKKNPADRPASGQLIAMINQLGPVTPASLGSFWPGTVARAIAAEQAAQTPAGLTPPAAFPGTIPVGAGAAPGPSGIAAPAAERAPTALAAPAPGQAAGATGHAPMISDGYYAAARRPSAPVPLPSGPPQSYSGRQPYVAQPGGQGPSGQVPPVQAPYQGQAPAYPGQEPGTGHPVSQYAPGRRKPMAAEVPPAVYNAIRLMYAGFAATAVDVVLTLGALGRHTYSANVAQANANKAAALGETARAAAYTSAMNAQNTMAGAAATGLISGVLGLACWVWLAVATRRGNGWPRVAGTVLLGIYSIVTLIVVFGAKRDPSAELTTIVVWILGAASVIPLWTQQAREFFFTWRRP
ncbi:MAG TPA: protein kinase [Trebonia sp.]|nr:protein kinase [Trebonia sp.]